MRDFLFKLLFKGKYNRLLNLEKTAAESIMIIASPKDTECIVTAVWAEFPGGETVLADISQSPIIIASRQEE